MPLDRDYVQRVMHAWANRVNSGDTLITFNWDPLHEMILWNAQKWHYQDGYGFRVPSRAPEALSSVLTLKLHGSCNWALRHRGDRHPSIEYIAELFPGASDGDTDMPLGASADHGESLILPSYLKAPTQTPSLHTVWAQAADVLRHAENVIVLGYSLPLADVPTRAMVSLALNHNKNLGTIRVVLGYPQDESTLGAYERWEDFCAVVSKGVERVYKTFEDFVLGDSSES
jgi:hypothetical protein